MILSGVGTRNLLVNLFSEFILSKFPKDSKSIIEIADCENFLVIKGMTNYSEVLDISKVIDEFISKYSEYINKDKFHSIDLIEYDKKMKDIDFEEFELHNSINPFYTSKQIDFYNEDNKKSFDYDGYVINNSFIITNSYPNTISLNYGKELLYYAKHIMYNIPSNYYVNSLRFKIYKDNIEIYNENERDFTLESAILDVFNFDMSWLKKELESVDFCQSLINPILEFEFVKNKVSDFIII